MLESLGSQLVPHDFHSTTDDSSLFGSPTSEEGNQDITEKHPEHSPTGTVRNSRLPNTADRSRWKTLRDFVDERAIEDVLETLDSHRGTLDVRLGFHEEYTRSI